MSAKACVILLGGGGHARVLLDSLLVCPDIKVLGLLDADPARTGSIVYGVQVLGTDTLLPELAARGVTHFAVGLGSVGDNGPRRRLFEAGLAAALRPLLVRHRSAVISPRAQVGEGCQFLPGCIVNAGAELGVDVIINSGAIVEHDCRIGDHAHLATGARLCGAVRLGNGAHVGAGAIVRQSITIAEDAVVGAGAVVIRDVDRGQVVVGNPARILTS